MPISARPRRRKTSWTGKHLRACTCGRVWNPRRRKTCPDCKAPVSASICLTCDRAWPEQDARASWCVLPGEDLRRLVTACAGDWDWARRALRHAAGDVARALVALERQHGSSTRQRQNEPLPPPPPTAVTPAPETRPTVAEPDMARSQGTNPLWLSADPEEHPPLQAHAVTDGVRDSPEEDQPNDPPEPPPAPDPTPLIEAYSRLVRRRPPPTGTVLSPEAEQLRREILARQAAEITGSAPTTSRPKTGGSARAPGRSGNSPAAMTPVPAPTSTAQGGDGRRRPPAPRRLARDRGSGS